MNVFHIATSNAMQVRDYIQSERKKARQKYIYGQSNFGQRGTIVSFRLGLSDAAILAKQFYPVFYQ